MTEFEIAIIVPVLNEERNIRACLDALEQQSIERETYEIVVVDNGSTDGTCEYVRSSSARLLVETKTSPYAARNRAINDTSAAWLALTDATCIAEPTWLEKLLKRADETDSLIVGGLTRYDVLSPTLGNRLFFETHSPEQMREAVETHQCIAGNNLFVHRSLFQRCGLFREMRSGSDIEFSKRVSGAGNRCVFAEHAVVRRQCDLSNWQYLQRNYRIRRGQRIHADAPGGLRALIGELRHLPWKPGLRAVRSAPHPGCFASEPGFFAEWLYRWAVRWARFFGAVSGTWKQPDDVERVPLRYEGPPVESSASQQSLAVFVPDSVSKTS